MLLLRFAIDLEVLAKVESMPSLEGKKMFLTLAPKKAGQPKKSQQKRDNEAAEAQAKAEREAEAKAEDDRPNPNSPFAGLAEKLAAADKD